MAAVIGLDDAEVERLCDGIEGVWAANYNCPGQVVVSGTLEGVAAFMTAAEAAGARRVVKLKVSGGFHSPLTALGRAAAGGPVLEATAFARAARAVLLDRHCRARGCARHRPDPRCSSSRRPCASRRPSRRCATSVSRTFVEVGPGSVLSGLIRRIDRSLSSVSVVAPEDIAACAGAGRQCLSSTAASRSITGASRGIGRASRSSSPRRAPPSASTTARMPTAAAAVVAEIEARGRAGRSRCRPTSPTPRRRMRWSRAARTSSARSTRSSATPASRATT